MTQPPTRKKIDLFTQLHKNPKNPREKARLKQMGTRIVFPQTHEAHTAVIYYRGKRRFFRTPKHYHFATKNNAQRDYTALAIAHTLYPKYFPKPVGVT